MDNPIDSQSTVLITSSLTFDDLDTQACGPVAVPGDAGMPRRGRRDRRRAARRGGSHGFRNESGAPASMLLLVTPGAPREDYFETLVEPGRGRTMTAEECAELMIRHDTYWL
jgi:hypothetical protein